MSEISFRREYPHPVERVFAAFSQPEKLASWLAPGPGFVTEVEHFDFRPGGAFQVGFRLPGRDGAHVLRGSYIAIDAPRHLRFTWEWLAPDPHAGTLSEVNVHFEPREQGSLLHLIHGRLSATGMPGRHAAVWPLVLDRLQTHLETP